jgi:hypothetical protein
MSHVLDRIAYQIGDLAAKHSLPPQPWVVVNQNDWPTIESEASHFDGILNNGIGLDAQTILFGLPVWRSHQIRPDHIEIMSEGKLLERYGVEFESANGKRFYATG